jgi:hypothetical protein
MRTNPDGLHRNAKNRAGRSPEPAGETARVRPRNRQFPCLSVPYQGIAALQRFHNEP